MNKIYLQSKLKSTATAYICWLFGGFHYAYLGKWGMQILFWCTIGGLGIWALIDLFLIPSKVSSHNLVIMSQIDEIDKKEKEDSHARNMAMITAAVSNTK